MADGGRCDTAALTVRLDVIRARYPGSDPEMVASVVRAVIETMQPGPRPGDVSLLREVEELGRLIAATRAEIAALGMEEISASHIPSATDELDAIVAHTAAATDSILEVCETLDRAAATAVGEAAAHLQDATTRIYEACSFQDITGQRITKVVTTLKAIDAKIARIVGAFAADPAAAPPPAAARPAAPAAQDALLHGPQLPASAMHQSDIDALLASFD